MAQIGKTVQSFTDQLERCVARHGYLGLGRLCLAKMKSLVSLRQDGRSALIDDLLEFDRIWSVSTGGDVLPSRAEVVGNHWIYGGKYRGVQAEVLESLLGQLSIRFEQFTFLDLGSGKGRALLIASRFPFGQIIGVEYCAELNDVARRNIALFPADAKRCSAIQTACCDAAAYPIPDGPLLLFLYNPFGRHVLERVVSSVVASYQVSPRPILVIYFLGIGACPQLWERTGFLRRARSDSKFVVFESEHDHAGR